MNILVLHKGGRLLAVLEIVLEVVSGLAVDREELLWRGMFAFVRVTGIIANWGIIDPFRFETTPQ